MMPPLQVRLAEILPKGETARLVMGVKSHPRLMAMDPELIAHIALMTIDAYKKAVV